MFEELTVPPIIAENRAWVERQVRFADEDGLPGRATKARISVAARRRASIEADAERRRALLGIADRIEGAHPAYETFYKLSLGPSTLAQLKPSSAGIAD